MIGLFALSVFSPPLGVPPSLYAKYEQAVNTASNTFACFDGSGIIPLSFINNNYPDCDDSSDEPGTGLNPFSKFECVDRGGRSIALHGWSVGDGICDCCDGSDEQFNPHANCSNSCFDTRLLDLKAIYPKFRHICRLSQSEVDKMLKQQDNRITSLSSNLRKLRNREQSLEKNRAMQISVPTRFDPPGLWRKLVMGLWDVTFFAPRLPAGVRKTRFDLAMEPIRAESVNASEEIQRINVFSDNAQKIDRCLIPLFGRSYSVGRYGLRFLAEVRHGKRSLGCFRKLLENGNQWYENYEERQSVEMKVVCGPVERWVNVRETGAGKYVSTFATPVMCDDNAIRRLKNLTSGDLDDLRAAARID